MKVVLKAVWTVGPMVDWMDGMMAGALDFLTVDLKAVVRADTTAMWMVANSVDWMVDQTADCLVV